MSLIEWTAITLITLPITIAISARTLFALWARYWHRRHRNIEPEKGQVWLDKNGTRTRIVGVDKNFVKIFRKYKGGSISFPILHNDFSQRRKDRCMYLRDRR